MAQEKIHLSLRLNTWFYSFTLSGERFRGSTGVKESNPDGLPMDKERASVVAEKIYRREARGKKVFNPFTEDAASLFNRYIERKIIDGLAPSTAANYRKYSQKFLNYFPSNLKLSVLVPEDMEEWKAHLLASPAKSYENGRKQVDREDVHPKTLYKRRKRLEERQRTGKVLGNGKTLSPKTVRECLAFVAAVCNYFDLHNPLKTVRSPQLSEIEKQKRLKYYSRQQLERLILVAKDTDEEFHHWLVFISNTGCRIGEAQGLTASNMDLQEGTVFLISNKRKSGRTVNIEPLREWEMGEDVESTAMSLHWLLERAKKHHGEEWHDDKPLYVKGKGWFAERLEAAAMKAKVPVLTPHALRHSFVTLAMAQGYDLATVAKVVGHRCISTTYNTYSHLSRDIKISLEIGGNRRGRF